MIGSILIVFMGAVSLIIVTMFMYFFSRVIFYAYFRAREDYYRKVLDETIKGGIKYGKSDQEVSVQK